MNQPDLENVVLEIRTLEQRLAELHEQRRELEHASHSQSDWQQQGFYTSYYFVAGLVLGMLAAVTSLLFNVLGSYLVENHPLRLIQIYLTFPLGEQALELNDARSLIIGSCLYLITGMIIGGPFYLILMATVRNSEAAMRWGIATVLAIAMWLLHFYGILSWLQPWLIGGNWIVEQIPWWVGCATHIVYGWTMAILFSLGQYVPYRRQLENS